MNGTSSSNGPQSHQILCCAFNASGTVFVTGSSDTFARVHPKTLILETNYCFSTTIIYVLLFLLYLYW